MQWPRQLDRLLSSLFYFYAWSTFILMVLFRRFRINPSIINGRERKFDTYPLTFYSQCIPLLLDSLVVFLHLVLALGLVTFLLQVKSQNIFAVNWLNINKWAPFDERLKIHFSGGPCLNCSLSWASCNNLTTNSRNNSAIYTRENKVQITLATAYISYKLLM